MLQDCLLTSFERDNLYNIYLLQDKEGYLIIEFSGLVLELICPNTILDIYAQIQLTLVNHKSNQIYFENNLYKLIFITNINEDNKVINNLELNNKMRKNINFNSIIKNYIKYGKLIHLILKYLPSKASKYLSNRLILKIYNILTK